MSDMGGTTTDLGVVVEGRLQIAEEGAEIGGWRTMVKAADVRTIGLGGDSEVSIGMNGSITIGPGRIVPLSLIGDRFPETLALLAADLADNEGGSMHGKFVLRPFGSQGMQESAELSPREREILALVTDRPTPIRKVAVLRVRSAAWRVCGARGLSRSAALHRPMPRMSLVSKTIGRRKPRRSVHSLRRASAT
jgi:N-methylhydantoinase A/oxoprolinase/acetone carboxylase beta subunit